MGALLIGTTIYAFLAFGAVQNGEPFVNTLIWWPLCVVAIPLVRWFLRIRKAAFDYGRHGGTQARQDGLERD
jgi:hypothetical protein